jgi:tRNA threonylcarbamoyladenosine biosynthesis protein TsaB
MRVLAIETSTRRGSVALVDDDRVVCTARHDEQGAHAERILPLVEELFGQAGWAKSSVDRLGVGVGPGAFTGIRIGIALAQGLGLGLDRPVFGVGSLEAMARAVPAERQGVRVALLDARREEVFVAIYEPAGATRLPETALARAQLVERLPALCAAPRVVVGEVGLELGVPDLFRSDATDLPDAVWTARIAATRALASASAVPNYVRDAGATLPNLPPSPFAR